MRLRSGVSMTLSMCCASLDRHAEEYRSRSMTLGGFRHDRRQADFRAETLARLRRSGAGALLGRGRARPRGRSLRTHDGAAEHLHRRIERAHARRQQAAGQRLGGGRGHRPLAQLLQDDGLHRLLVDAEHQVAEQAAQQGLLAVEQALSSRLVVALGDDAHLDAVDAAGLEGDGGVAELVELLDAGPPPSRQRPTRSPPKCAARGRG